MAKVVVTFEDLPDGGVRTVSDPLPSKLMERLVTAKDLSPAEGYAVAALNAVREKSKQMGNKFGLLLPRVRR